MIRNIRRRFIRIALMVLALAMALVTLIINAASWVNVLAELRETMGYLAEASENSGHKGGPKSRRAHAMLDESRFFSVIILEDGTCVLGNAFHLSDADGEALLRIAQSAVDSGRASGFEGEYLFAITEQRNGRAATFLNCETQLARVRRLGLVSAAAYAGCILLAWLLVSLFSSRAIRPLVENAIQQKQFITDAGHELKTPLTVISANMDVLALETGKNEWIQSTRKQLSNMRGLVNELIYLSRLDEEDARLPMREFDLTVAVRDATEPFLGMAEFAGKSMALDTADGIRMTGDEAAVRRLVSILCDNAVKYAPQGDAIALTLARTRKGVRLCTENGLEKPLPQEALDHLFDRFYRADASRSKDSGGYGIGLSVARAIVQKHGGDIRAVQTDAGRLKIICTLRG